MVEFWMGAYDCCRALLTAIRSAEAAREISHQRIEDRDFKLSNSSNSFDNEKPRNRDMRFRDLIAAIEASMRYGPLIVLIGVSGIEISICKEHNATKTMIL